ncbi:hypothetical protein IJT17_03785 [bacterium]|nr:hypothetical protein [bacterium]
MFKRAVKWLAAVLACIVALGIVGEIYLRFKGYPVAEHYIDDPVLFWSPKAGAKPSEEDASVNETIGVNGMRVSRPDPGYSKRYRVAISGCSYTFGMGVADKDTYVWKLGELCPEADFDNLGVKGYGPYRSYLRLCRYLERQKYDLVVYAMQDNHIDRDSFAHQTFSSQQKQSDLIVLPFVEMRAPGEFVMHNARMAVWPGDTKSRLINFLRNFCLSMEVRMQRVPSEEEKKEIFAYIINQMAAVSKQHGAKFVLAVLNRNPVPKSLFSSDVDIIDIAYKNGEELDDSERVGGKPNNHPNASVHDFWAHALAAKLREHGYFNGSK